MSARVTTTECLHTLVATGLREVGVLARAIARNLEVLGYGI